MSESKPECPWKVGDPISIFEDHYLAATSRKDTTVARLTKTLVIDAMGNRWAMKAWSPRDEQMRFHGGGYSNGTTVVLSPASPGFVALATRSALAAGTQLAERAAREWGRLDRKDRTPEAMRAYAEILELAAATIRKAADGVES